MKSLRPFPAAMRCVPGCLALVMFGSGLCPAAEELPRVEAVPEAIRKEFGLAAHYRKFVSAGGLPVVASSKVHDVALLEARFLILQMIGHRPEILAALAKNHVRFAIMACDEFTTDIPEHSDLAPKLYWDRRARGLGATRARPAVSCGEENLLALPGDPYAAENILIHEFAHAVHQMGVNSIDPSFQARLRSAFEAATRAGLWTNKYAGTNASEYFAEGVQSWFNTNRENDPDHNHVNTRAELKAHDAGLAQLCAEVFGDLPWTYEWPTRREPLSSHFVGFTPDPAARFAWPKELTMWQEKFRRGEVTMAPVEAVALTSEAPDSRPEWRSAESSTRVDLFFQNARREPVLLFWIDRNGAEHAHGKLRQAEHTRLSSFTGHVFRVTDENRVVLHYFTVGAQPSSAVIR